MKKIWSYTIQLGFNMWRDENSVPENDGPFQCQSTGHYQKTMLTERDTWRRVVDQLPSFGVNTLLIDLGEGVQYKSHPELAVEGAWTVEELKEELARIRALGMEPIPKLNFSSYHDAWLTPYCAQKGTDAYDKVVADLIDEVCEIFDSPRFFNLGMDEEEFPNSPRRTNWWHNDYVRTNTTPRDEAAYFSDLAKMVARVEKNGARAWIVGDYFCTHPEAFLANCPKSCVLSMSFWDRIVLKPDGSYPDRPIYDEIRALAAAGFDQIPEASDWTCHQNIPQFVYFYMEFGLVNEHLLGFNAVPMQATVDLNYYTLLNNANRVKFARAMFEDPDVQATAAAYYASISNDDEAKAYGKVVEEEIG
ncbi:MAG: hypothetical protein IJW50_09470 [Clostridia bacterium]|nr:hypothetical protein [Clostridia bacterium]